jgi:hypothetical protein
LNRGKEDDPVSKELKGSLDNSELLVDYKKEDNKIYALVSKEGIHQHKDQFVVFEQNAEGKWERSYENDFTGLKPWKIETADIDGDKEKELLIAVYKTTHFDNVKRNRLFIFNYHNNILEKKWTGSQIAGTWKDFYVGDVTGRMGDELIFLQKTAEGKERLVIYYWFDFGFFFLAESGTYTKITNISVTKDNKIVLTYKEGIKPGIYTLEIKNDKLKEE